MFLSRQFLQQTIEIADFQSCQILSHGEMPHSVLAPDYPSDSWIFQSNRPFWIIFIASHLEQHGQFSLWVCAFTFVVDRMFAGPKKDTDQIMFASITSGPTCFMFDVGLIELRKIVKLFVSLLFLKSEFCISISLLSLNLSPRRWP